MKRRRRQFVDHEPIRRAAVGRDVARRDVAGYRTAVPNNRPAIPADIQRAVILEAGGRCAIPRCNWPTVELAHIVPWEKVQKHEFSNIIALCPNCHTGYDNATSRIDLKAMRQIKANLATLNARYGDSSAASSTASRSCATVFAGWTR